MAKTSIEWCLNADGTPGSVWNPTRGCSRISEGCTRCYAERQAARNLPGLRFPDGENAARRTRAGDPHWTGRVELIESMLDIPLRRKKPATFFVNSMSDLFHEALSDEARDRIFAVAMRCPQHYFFVLTKRAKKMQEYASDVAMRGVGLGSDVILRIAALLNKAPIEIRKNWPPKNVGFGVSAENQQTADEGIRHLLQTPAALRFVSLEPMLGPIVLRAAWVFRRPFDERRIYGGDTGALDWVILGGESGPGARPMNPQWARDVRDACVSAGVRYFYKQAGEWAPWSESMRDTSHGILPRRVVVLRSGSQIVREENFAEAIAQGGVLMARVGKRTAGHLLDGQSWRQMPEVRNGR